MMNSSTEKGFTLLEALVTVVVISIGLLGLLGLQTVSIANTQTSAARTNASVAADSMADRVRSNEAAASKGDYAYDSPFPAPPSEPKPLCVGGTNCTAAQMAAYDFYEWNTSLDQLLPNGRGYLKCSATSGTQCLAYTITVAWSERDRGSNGTSDSDTTDRCAGLDSVKDRCFQTVVRP